MLALPRILNGSAGRLKSPYDKIKSLLQSHGGLYTLSGTDTFAIEPNRDPTRGGVSQKRKVKALREALCQLIDAVIVLLALSSACGCLYAQNPQAAATSADAITGCNAELAAQVKAALRAAPAVNDTHIDAICENGNVVLTGLVEDERALVDAMRVARRAANGRPIIDALSIMKTSPR